MTDVLTFCSIVPVSPPAMSSFSSYPSQGIISFNQLQRVSQKVLGFSQSLLTSTIKQF